MRQNPGLYEQNCVERNYAPYARNGWKILEIHERLSARQKSLVEMRQRNNAIGKEMKGDGGQHQNVRSKLIAEARELKQQLQESDTLEKEAMAEMEQLALEMPNLSSLSTPIGSEPVVIDWINGEGPPADHSGTSHVDIGKELDLLDFEGSATTSGWGWYFLKNEAALLEQALIQYALELAAQRSWEIWTPPSLVYSHIASGCGFMPRDQNGETQVYAIAQETTDESNTKPSLVLAGTAEIPFAGSRANHTFSAQDLPLKVIGPSRCYRAEAGARGVDTKGLYRVHEFTKVEMFAWEAPKLPSDDHFVDLGHDDEHNEAPVFEEMVALQKDILRSLGLHARVLEMPSADLGASAQRKIDIEVFFPSRIAIDGGYGEVTSASICGDYQARRLATRVKFAEQGGKLAFASTCNGTAMAVPRIIAALLENGWCATERSVTVPQVLRKWMPDGQSTIHRKRRV